MKIILSLLYCLLTTTLILADSNTNRTKLSDTLWEMSNIYSTPRTSLANSSSSNKFSSIKKRIPVPDKSGYITISALSETNSEELRAELVKLGAKSCKINGRVLTFTFPVTNISSLPGITQLKHARVSTPILHAGRVTSQGDIAQRSSLARSTYGVSGKNVRVGILSDSFNRLNGMNAGISSGDLPSDIQILSDLPSTLSGRDEGRAMGEIIHDVAPGASLAFYTAFMGEADFANGILELANFGCNVIVDDVLYLEEPFFADGIVAQAVNEVTKNGVAYFSSAGNGGESSYEAYINIINGYHDTIPDPDLYDDGIMMAILNGTASISIQWSDAYASTSQDSLGATTDLDVEVADSNRKVIFGSYNNNIGLDPIETFGINVSSTNRLEFVYLRVKYKSGDLDKLRNMKIKLIHYSTGGSMLLAYTRTAGTIVGHMNSKGAITVGAVNYKNTPANDVTPPVLENFSSAGNVPIMRDILGTPIYEVREKPDFCAPDGADTTFFSSSDTDKTGFPNFFGTSASAPHAAAVGALMIDANSSISPERIRKILRYTSIEMLTNGFDFKSGYGFIQANKAIERVLITPPTVLNIVSKKSHGMYTHSIDLSENFPYTIEGRYGTNLNIVFSFDKNISTARPVMYSGTGNVTSTTINNNEVAINITGITNNQWISVGLTDIESVDKGYLEHAYVTFGVLFGDVNGTGNVDQSDVTITTRSVGYPVTSSNFNSDVVSNGYINSGDIFLIKKQLNTKLPQF